VRLVHIATVLQNLSSDSERWYPVMLNWRVSHPPEKIGRIASPLGDVISCDKAAVFRLKQANMRVFMFFVNQSRLSFASRKKYRYDQGGDGKNPLRPSREISNYVIHNTRCIKRPADSMGRHVAGSRSTRGPNGRRKCICRWPAISA
jgi:hypothetical protein